MAITLKSRKRKFDYSNEKLVVQSQSRPSPPFPQKLNKAKKNAYFKKFFGIFRKLHIRLPLLDVLKGIPKYAKY